MSWVAYVGLGASTGERRATLQSAADRLAGHPGVRWVAASRVYRTRPIGNATQPFLNAACELAIDSAVHPPELMAWLLELERAHGRDRHVDTPRWSDRPLDLDVLAARDEAGVLELDTPDLKLPHPRAHERDFVLAPLCELAPALQIQSQSVAHWLRHLGPADRTILGTEAPLRPNLPAA